MLAKLTDGHIYLVTLVTLLVKRIPKYYSETASEYYTFERSPGIAGRVLDARKYARLACQELAKNEWNKDPLNLPLHLMTHVYVVWQCVAYLLLIPGMGSLIALGALEIVDSSNPIAQFFGGFILVAVFISLGISMPFGIPALNVGQWLQKEQKENQAKGIEINRSETFIPLGKFRPRLLDTIVIYALWGTFGAWLFWIIETEVNTNLGKALF